MAKQMPTILYIETYEPLAKVVVDYFQAKSVDAIAMGDRALAIRKIHKINPHLILLSEQSHPYEEDQFLLNLQEKKPKYAHIPIIYLYHHEDALKLKKMELFTHIIEKPFSLWDLSQCIFPYLKGYENDV